MSKKRPDFAESVDDPVDIIDSVAQKINMGERAPEKSGTGSRASSTKRIERVKTTYYPSRATVLALKQIKHARDGKMLSADKPSQRAITHSALIDEAVALLKKKEGIE